MRKGIRAYLFRGVREALSLASSVDAVWLRRTVAEHLSMYRPDVHVHDEESTFDNMVIGYTGDDDQFHGDEDCPHLSGTAREIPETKALKWGYDYCLECVAVFPDRDDP